MAEPLTANSDGAVHDIMDRAQGLAARKTSSLSRRGFLKVTGVAGLVIAFDIGPGATGALAAERKPADAFVPNAFVQITPDGTIRIYSKGPEIGQGIKTAFPMIVAEEMCAAWKDVNVAQAPINPKVYGRQSAGGSTSILLAWDQLRQAGAVVRTMLVGAAAKEWKVPESECKADKSAVVHTPTSRAISFGDLATRAAKLPVPDAKSVKLKSRDQYTLLGSRVTGVDNHALVTGEALFGIDQKLPDMVYATYTMCPAVGGKVKSANYAEIKSMPGVLDVFALEGTGQPTEVMPGVAIIARSTYQAIAAKRRLQVNWDESGASKDSWSQSVDKAKSLAGKPGEKTLVDQGNVDDGFKSAHKTVEGFYTYPFVTHATLEPMNCTAHVTRSKAEFWSPTQTPDGALGMLAKLLGVPQDKVVIHQTRVGGGFGRRLMNDYMCQVALIAKKVGKPVKLQWTREDDMTHDFYRVGGFHALKGGVDRHGKITVWQDHFITFSADGKTPVAGGTMGPSPRFQSPAEMPAPFLANFRLTQTMLPLAIPCGPWRAPSSNGIAFPINAFLHELAVAGGRDHVELLLELFDQAELPAATNPFAKMFTLNPARAKAVVKLAADKAGWGKRQRKGRGLGLSFYFSHAGHFAEIADLSVDDSKRITLHRIVVAGDVGPIVNLSGAESQVQGAALDGLSTMLSLEMQIENGRVSPNNFDRYQPLRIPAAPPVEAHFIQSDNHPTGLGEPALPPIAAAITNAIYAATGERVRTLPLAKSGYHI